MNMSPLLVGILMIIIITSTTTFFSNRVAYAHTFSENENALFLTVIHQIESQTQLAESNFPTNVKLAQQHTSLAISLLNQNDPIVNNTTWGKEIAERNPRVAAELTSALNSLKSAITQSKPSSNTTTATNNTINDIKTKVTRVSDLLGEAISSRVSKEVLNNSTTQALVLANLANEIYFSYGRALGESPTTMSNMAGMAMSGKGGSMDMNMMANGNAGMSSNMAMTSSNTIKNLTDYQTAQSLAAKAQEIFNKNLKPLAATSKVTAANAQVDRDLIQLKTAIDNKAPFMDIMKLVHVQLHPTLITAYNLQLKSF
ncbi:MAG: hypothetical protein JO297_06160 [Nitrososphaeraceae archaeon]|nr:hypothetical protein [Nitrososphaeraceae archaeon]